MTRNYWQKGFAEQDWETGARLLVCVLCTSGEGLMKWFKQRTGQAPMTCARCGGPLSIYERRWR